VSGGWFVCLEAVETTGWAVAFDCRVVASGRTLEGVFVAEMASFAADPAFFERRGNTAFICGVVKCEASLALFIWDCASSWLDAYAASEHKVTSFGNLFCSFTCFVNEYKRKIRRFSFYVVFVCGLAPVWAFDEGDSSQGDVVA
jgi:hypothetical protein